MGVGLEVLVISRDAAWVTRLGKVAERGGWPIEARGELPARGAGAFERVLVVLDRSLAGAVPARTVAALRELCPGASVALACAEREAGPNVVSEALTSGADETVLKSWSDDRLTARLSTLRDRALATDARVSADGGLSLDRRARRAYARSRAGWLALDVTAPGFELLWRLLEHEGRPVSRAELADALDAAFGREAGPETVSRRILALRRALAPWPGTVESARDGRYRLVSARRRSST